MPGKKFNRAHGASLHGIPPGSKKDRDKKIVGENTSELRKDKKGKKFALLMEDAGGLKKGDTIRPGKAPITGNFIMGGDYSVKKIGKGNYKIK